jgi:hypothetical protein
MNVSKLAILCLVAVAAGGCAHGPSRSQEAADARPSAPPLKHVKLGVLPVESDAYPRLAAGVNELLRAAKVPDVDEYFQSKVTLEVVQLSIECVDPSDECFTAVGKSLACDRLLLVHLHRPAKKRDKLRVSVTLFDVGSGAAVHRAERAFKSESEAVGAVHELIESAVDGRQAEATR